MRRLTYFGLFSLSVGTLLSAMLCDIDPGSWFSLTGFAFQYLWVATALLIVATALLFPRKRLFIYVLPWAFTIPWATEVIDFGSPDLSAEESKDGYKIVTYNVHALSNPETKKSSADSIFAFLKRSDADIICLQEIQDENLLKKMKSYKGFKERYPNRHFQEYTLSRGQWMGMAIYSRHPLVGVELPNDEKNDSHKIVAAADIELGERTIRVLSCHLQSLCLTPTEVSTSSTKDRHVNKDRMKKMLQVTDKIIAATRIRSKQADYVNAIVNDSPYPTVVCGDFNDIPMSYSYRTIAHATPKCETERGLTSRHEPVQPIFSNTLRLGMPPIRIDHILTSASIGGKEYREHDLEFSDHEALSCRLTLK